MGASKTTIGLLLVLMVLVSFIGTLIALESVLGYKSVRTHGETYSITGGKISFWNGPLPTFKTSGQVSIQINR